MTVYRTPIKLCAVLMPFAAIVIGVSAPANASAPLAVAQYSGTRSVMNYRAASRATSRAAELRRYCRAHPKAKKCLDLKRAQKTR